MFPAFKWLLIYSSDISSHVSRGNTARIGNHHSWVLLKSFFAANFRNTPAFSARYNLYNYFSPFPPPPPPSPQKTQPLLSANLCYYSVRNVSYLSKASFAHVIYNSSFLSFRNKESKLQIQLHTTCPPAWLYPSPKKLSIHSLSLW